MKGKAELLNELMSNKGVCRTALVTLDLLNIFKKKLNNKIFNVFFKVYIIHHLVK